MRREQDRNQNTIIIKIMMIDLHTHILPNMDDGAHTSEEALAMTELLFQQGIQGAVCTPHFDPTRMVLEDFVKRRDKAMSQMKASRILLIPASETLLHDALFYYSSLDPLIIKNTEYLLLELPFDKKWQDSIYTTLEKLMLQYDIIPIIAHIERYPATKKKYIKRLKRMGCIIQLNTSSLFDNKLKRKALSYIQDGLVDVLGSDCHNLKSRPPEVQMALELIKNQLGASYYVDLIKQSERVAKGFDIR